MRMDLRLLRDRDDAQQKEINKLREELAESEKEKHTALETVEDLTKENVALRKRVDELERVVEHGRT
jgi:predicted nuclease with TOPRIM domain